MHENAYSNEPANRFSRVYFPLDTDEDGWPPYTSETMWAIRMEDGSFKIDNIPFFVPMLSYGDIVTAIEQDGLLRFVKKIGRSGHSTVRVMVPDEDIREQIIQAFKDFGCEVEMSPIDRLFAVDIPPSAAVEDIRRYLKDGFENDILDYEEACVWWPTEG